MKNKKKPGRPKAEEGFKKFRILNLASDQLEFVSKRSILAGVSKAELIRYVSLKYQMKEQPKSVVETHPENCYIHPVPVRFTEEQDKELRKRKKQFNLTSVNAYLRFALTVYRIEKEFPKGGNHGR